MYLYLDKNSMMPVTKKKMIFFQEGYIRNRKKCEDTTKTNRNAYIRWTLDL